MLNFNAAFVLHKIWHIWVNYTFRILCAYWPIVKRIFSDWNNFQGFVDYIKNRCRFLFARTLWDWIYVGIILISSFCPAGLQDIYRRTWTRCWPVIVSCIFRTIRLKDSTSRNYFSHRYLDRCRWDFCQDLEQILTSYSSVVSKDLMNICRWNSETEVYRLLLLHVRSITTAFKYSGILHPSISFRSSFDVYHI